MIQLDTLIDDRRKFLKSNMKCLKSVLDDVDFLDKDNIDIDDILPTLERLKNISDCLYRCGLILSDDEYIISKDNPDASASGQRK